MGFSKWLQSIFGQANRRQKRANRRNGRALHRFQRLFVEPLESRNVLTVTLVGSTATQLNFQASASSDQLVITYADATGNSGTYSGTGLASTAFSATAGQPMGIFFNGATPAVLSTGLTINGSGSADTITLNNNLVSGNLGVANYGSLGSQITTSTTPGFLTSLNVNMQGAADTINVRGISNGLTTAQINGNDGNDVFNVSSDAPANLGTLDQLNLTATFLIDGGLGVNDLIVSDFSSISGNSNVVVTANQIQNMTATGILNYQATGGSFGTFRIEGSNASSGITESFLINNPNGPLTLNTNDGVDTVTVTNATSAVTVNTGLGDDVINLGAPGANNIDGILNTVTVEAAQGNNQLFVNDTSTTTLANNIQITATQILNLAGSAHNQTINYAASGGAFSTLSVFTSGTAGFSEIVTVTNPNGPLTLFTQAGNDRINVVAIAAGNATAIDAGAGDDTINVSSLSATAPLTGDLNGIQAALSILAGSGANALVVSDTNGNTANSNVQILNATINNFAGSADNVNIAYTAVTGSYSSIIVNGSNSNEVYQINNPNTAAFTLNDAAGTNTFNIQSLNVGTGTINGGSGVDTFNIESAAPAGTGNLDSINFALTVNGLGGVNVLNMFDVGPALVNGTVGTPAVIGNTTITGLAGNANQTTVTYSGAYSALNITTSNNAGQAEFITVNNPNGPLNLFTQAGNDTVNVQAIGLATAIDTGAGNDFIRVTSATTDLNSISANLTIEAGVGTNSLTVDDTNGAANTNATITNTTITGMTANGVITYLASGGGNFIAGPGTTGIIVNTSNAAAVGDVLTVTNPNGTLTLNSQDGPDTVEIRQTSFATIVNTGAGGDTVNVQSIAGATGSLDLIGAALTFDFGTGPNDFLFLNDSVSTALNNAVVINNSVQTVAGFRNITGLAGAANNFNINYANNGGVAGDLTLSIMGALSTTQAEVFTIDGSTLNTGPGANLILNAQGGDDTLNIQGTTIGTTATVNGGAGNDVFNISSTAATGVAAGNLDGINGILSIDAGAGTNTLSLSDFSTGTANANAFITATQFLQFAGAGDTTTLNYGATGGTFSNVTVNGSNNIATFEQMTLGNPVLFSANAPSGPLTLNMNNGSDTVNILSLGAAATIDTGAGDNDVINVGGTATAFQTLDVITVRPTLVGGSGVGDTIVVRDNSTLANNYVINATSVASAADTVRAFAGINYDGSFEAVTVNGTDADNLFTVTPSQTAVITVNGGLNDTANPGDKFNFLNLAAAGVTSRNLINVGVGSGTWTFNSPVKNVVYTGIETQGAAQGYVTPAGSAAGTNVLPTVVVTDSVTGKVRFTIMAYESAFRGGVRVAVADMNGDGIPDIITAPGRGRNPDIKIFNGLTGALLTTKTNAYPTTYRSGVNVAAGDLDGDGVNEVVLSTTRGSTAVGLSEIKVFTGLGLTQVGANPIKAYTNQSVQGVSIAVIPYNASLGVQGGIVTVPSGGAVADVRIYDINGNQINAGYMQGFEKTFRGGATVAVGDIDGDGLADIVLGAGTGGNSRIQIFRQLGFNTFFQSLTPFTTFTDQSKLAPLTVALKDIDGTGRFSLFVGQGSAGKNQQILQYNFASYVGGNPSAGFNMSLVNRFRTASPGVFIA